MKMYVLQVKSGCEISVFNELKKQGFDAVMPTKQEFIRCNGKWNIREKIIFPQYIFIRFLPTENNYYKIKNINGVIRFLGNISPVTTVEQKYIEWLENGGKTIEPSKIYVTANGDKMIMSGILRNYSGNEIEYNLHKRKAVIFIEIAGVRHKISVPVIKI